MKRIIFAAITVILISGLCVTAGAQSEPSSLGDYARSIRKSKPQETRTAAKVYDNDNLPSTPSISVVGASSGTAAGADNQNAAPKADENAPAGDTKANVEDTPKLKPGESMEDRKKAISAWKDKIDEQKKKVDQLAKEVDDFKQAGTMPTVAVWPYNEKYQQGLADKQKALDAARADLAALQDQARKAGAPTSAIE